MEIRKTPFEPNSNDDDDKGFVWISFFMCRVTNVLNEGSLKGKAAAGGVLRRRKSAYFLLKPRQPQPRGNPFLTVTQLPAY